MSIPDPTQNVSVSSGDGSMQVLFDAPASDGGSAILDYTISLFDNAEPPSLLETYSNVSSSPYTITGLTNGTTYHFGVQARNSIGLGSIGQLVSGGPYAGGGSDIGGGGSDPIAPTVPVITSVSAGNGSLTVNFSESTANGGPAVSEYEAKAAVGKSTQIFGTGLSSPITLIGLTNGTQYTVTVRAVNTAGTYSAPSTSVLATPVASAPTTPPGPVPCFFGDAPVLTHGGYVRMDSLVEGVKVMTPAGSEATVERVKCYRVAAGPGANPYVIPIGRFGATQELLISPDHRVQTEEGLVSAKELGLEQEEREGFLVYYNLELTGGANMVVAGVPVESLAPVRRMVVPRAVFESLVAAKYGGRGAAEISQMIARTCRMLEGDLVEIPVMRR